MLMGLLAACCGEEEKRKIEYIYLHYGKTIFYIIHKRVESQSDAEDLTHDLFVKLIKMSDRLDLSKPGKLYSLLVMLAKNMVVDFMRKCRETDFDDSEAGCSIQLRCHIEQPLSGGFCFRTRELSGTAFLYRQAERKGQDHFSIEIYTRI